MKFYRLVIAVVLGMLCLGFGLVSAQDATPEATADPNIPVIPSKPLMPCPADVTATTVCDMIATKTEDIAGLWAVYFLGEPAFVRINADGTFVTAVTREATAKAVAGCPCGTFSFDSDGIWTTTDTDLPKELQSGRYRLRVIMVGGKPAALNLGLVEDRFNLRQSDYGFTLLWAGD